MERTAARAPRFVRSEFAVQSTLLGQPGASERFAAFVVPPSVEPTIAPPLASDIAEDFSAVRRTRSSWD
jgi:hypothetical protein